jgi:hypothetical protein
MAKKDENVEVLERGNIFFAYRPRVEEDSPEGKSDIQNFYMILSVHGEDRYRQIVIGREELPEIENGGGKYWAFVEALSKDPKKIVDKLKAVTYETKTRGEREQPAARPAGEGVYAIVRHEDHTHLAYVLELPEDPDDVQKALNIVEEASYVISVKNPDKSAPRGAGLPDHEQADFPRSLQERFEDRRFIDVDPPKSLNYEGAEMLLIGAKKDVGRELGLELNAQDEDESTAEMFDDLRMEKSAQPIAPLLEGDWA